jgi:hypothetical protein
MIVGLRTNRAPFKDYHRGWRTVVKACIGVGRCHTAGQGCTAFVYGSQAYTHMSMSEFRVGQVTAMHSGSVLASGGS